MSTCSKLQTSVKTVTWNVHMTEWDCTSSCRLLLMVSPWVLIHHLLVAISVSFVTANHGQPWPYCHAISETCKKAEFGTALLTREQCTSPGKELLCKSSGWGSPSKDCTPLVPVDFCYVNSDCKDTYYFNKPITNCYCSTVSSAWLWLGRQYIHPRYRGTHGLWHPALTRWVSRSVFHGCWDSNW